MTADKKEVWITEKEALERAGVKSSKTLDEWAKKYGYAEAKLFQGRRRRNLVIIEVFEAKYPGFARRGR
jgi:hypothetical protein